MAESMIQELEKEMEELRTSSANREDELMEKIADLEAQAERKTNNIKLLTIQNERIEMLYARLKAEYDALVSEK
eukprot:CAMPEP_0176451996 /NCGR_PEP_ID=MMETSP0127-20121128/28237_1 /TAXON_ID=938130 /ORGANISM="Platyophrya macrostoma, Strain WH" /LENGTH=73 /DNA_ID=CAMNT_0017840295 /DNA_START=10 /DNA_END=231 /DNA_ORIENTATION=+